MKCEWVRENIVLHVYGELADDARHELEQHVARCADCAAELKAEQDFHALLSQDRAVDPTPNLLAASRMRLQEALETAQQGSFWSRLAFDPANWLRQVRFSPALASAILILGFAGGVGSTYKFYEGRTTPGGGVITSNTPNQIPTKPRSPESVPSPRTQAPIRSASSTTRSRRRKRRDRSTIRRSSSCCCTRRAITTTRVCAWIRSTCWRRRRARCRCARL